MPIYTFRCENNHETDKYVHRIRPQRWIKCNKCGKRMVKIISLPNTNMVHNVRLSSSMGVNPKQIPEAERLYPGSKYTPDGRLIVESRKDKLQKMKERNLIEFE
ncbi:MAG: zinc ribbon domain-containing protein [Dehalococcoidia bacterium]|nr:zinc ribbon domain-containing protein [Dehalococcoidia bacterium]